MTPHDKAAKYFRKILLKKSPKAPYSIVRLVGHRNVAPVDVCSVVKVFGDLKALLLKYPDLFYVEKNNVSLVEQFELKNEVVQPSACDISQEVCKFFRSVLCKVSKFCPYSLNQLFVHRSSAQKVVQAAVKERHELSYYLQNNPTVFAMFKGYVVLSEFVDTINAIVSFYVSILKSCPEKTCTYEDLLSLSSKGPPCVKVAAMNKFKIKQLLLAFSSTFKIKRQNVLLVGNQSIIMVQKTQKVETPTLNYSASNVTTPSKDLVTVTNKLKNLVVSVENNSSPNANLQTTAANYFLEKMWSLKPFKVVPILTLYTNKCTAPSDIQSVCGNTPEDFKEFLSKCVESFIVTGEFVLARKNIPIKEWCPPYKGVEEQLSSVLHNFFKNITNNGKPEHIDKLFNNSGRSFINNNGERFFETSDDLAKFLGMFPESFYIFNNHVVNILNYDKECIREVSEKKSKRVIKESDEEAPVKIEKQMELDNWKDTVLSKTEFITDLEICKIRAKDILENETVIALDCEGLNLGIDGVLSLIQIGTKSGNVYIFDILTVREMLTSGPLKDICESNKILKVIHDCRNDSANLVFEFNIKLKNVFDTRLAHGVIVKQHNKPIAFNKLCQSYGAPINVEKDEFKDVYKTNPAFWLNRPMTENMLAYAALDVACLVPHVYNNMIKKLKTSKCRVLSLSEKALKTYL